MRLEILKQELQKIIDKEEKRKLKILNIGIATGKTSEMLSGFGEVTSLEYDATCAEFVRNELNIDVVEGSILKLPFKENSFDVVCAFDVIEHVEDDQKAILEMGLLTALRRVREGRGQLVPQLLHIGDAIQQGPLVVQPVALGLLGEVVAVGEEQVLLLGV